MHFVRLYRNLSWRYWYHHRPDQEPNDIAVIGEGVQGYEEVLTPGGTYQVKIFTELGHGVGAPTELGHTLIRKTYQKYLSGRG